MTDLDLNKVRFGIHLNPDPSVETKLNLAKFTKRIPKIFQNLCGESQEIVELQANFFIFIFKSCISTR